MLTTNLVAELVRCVPGRLCAITGVMLFATTPALAGRPADVPANFPDVQLQSRMRGQAAITALGAKLPAVDFARGVLVFEETMQEARMAWVDPDLQSLQPIA